MNEFVKFHKDGRVTVDLLAYLKSPEGKAQLASLKDLPPAEKKRFVSAWTCPTCGTNRIVHAQGK